MKKLVKAGEFNNASEVHRAALSGMAQQREERELRLAQLRAEIQRGLDSGRPEEISDLDGFLEECSEKALRRISEGK